MKKNYASGGGGGGDVSKEAPKFSVAVVKEEKPFSHLPGFGKVTPPIKVMSPAKTTTPPVSVSCSPAKVSPSSTQIKQEPADAEDWPLSAHRAGKTSSAYDKTLRQRFGLRRTKVKLPYLRNPDPRATIKIFRARVPRAFLEDRNKILNNGLCWGDITSDISDMDEPIPPDDGDPSTEDPICLPGPLLVGTTAAGWMELPDDLAPAAAGAEAAAAADLGSATEAPTVEYTTADDAMEEA
jgi:hypothetical protein